MAHKYINNSNGKYKVALKDDNDKTVANMLWGDPVRVDQDNGTHSHVLTGRHKAGGWVPNSALSDTGLLELYVIDVGQGDGVLMRTPDDNWHMIDAGVSNSAQMTKKGAANFVRWKFITDLGLPGVTLKNAIVTHPDFDHYGGMVDLLSGNIDPWPAFNVSVENFWHCGMGRFKDSPKLGAKTAGTVSPLPIGEYGMGASGNFITELLDGKGTFKNPARPLDGSFAKLAGLVGRVPQNVKRLSHESKFVKDYEEGSNEVIMRVLGPIVEKLSGGAKGLRVLGGESITRNGHSIVLRIEFGKARFLLTGDLNTASQRLLLSYHRTSSFAADVVKGCHHGSDDIDLRFVKAMAARTTVISSGDNEDYAHPRPRIIGASARYGRESKSTRGETLPPLVYSTELARSVKLDFAADVHEKANPANRLLPAEAELKITKGKYPSYTLDRTPVSTDLVYGLINVRTDGETILSGYMKESGKDFDIQTFKAGVEP